jgi:hypothetical protein
MFMKNLRKAQPHRIYVSEMIANKKRKLKLGFWLSLSISIIALVVAIIALFKS